MEEVGKELLKEELAKRMAQARHDLPKAQFDVMQWTAAVELWSQLDVPEEHGAAAAQLAVKQERQRQLELEIERLQLGLALLNR